MKTYFLTKKKKKINILSTDVILSVQNVKFSHIYIMQVFIITIDSGNKLLTCSTVWINSADKKLMIVIFYSHPLQKKAKKKREFDISCKCSPLKHQS